MNTLSLREQTKRARSDKAFDLNAKMVGRDKMPCEKTLTNKMSDTGSKCNVVKPIARKDVSKADGKRPVVPEAPPSYKKGGKIKKNGSALVHKDEVVLPVKLAKQLQKLVK